MACFSVGFGPTGLLPCAFIIDGDPGEDKRSVCERKSSETRANLEGSEAVLELLMNERINYDGRRRSKS